MILRALVVLELEEYVVTTQGPDPSHRQPSVTLYRHARLYREAHDLAACGSETTAA